MDINPKEIQKFYDIWAPMITSLPVVINALERANEAQNHVAILESRMADAQKATEAAAAEKVAQIANANAELEKIRALKAEALAEVKEMNAACKKDVAAAKKAAEAKIAEFEDKAAQSAAALARADDTLAQRLAEVDAAVAARMLEKEQELAAMEARRSAAEKALDSLRARLG